MNTILTYVLHNFRLAHAWYILDEELGFWKLPRSTAWFSQFLLHEYRNEHWITNFRFTKAAIFCLAEVLALYCERQDTQYCKVVPVRVRGAATIYKLVHGTSLLICFEQFAIGLSTLLGTLRDIVQAVNIYFWQEIQFPRGSHLQNVMRDFEEFCRLPVVAGAIDGTHIHIRKPYVGPEDYFYFKTSGYSM